jgi:hypothetical protein
MGGFADPSGRLESRQPGAREDVSRVAKEVDPVGRPVRTNYHKVHESVIIEVHGQRPSPEADPNIRNETRVMVGQSGQQLVGRVSGRKEPSGRET